MKSSNWGILILLLAALMSIHECRFIAKINQLNQRLDELTSCSEHSMQTIDRISVALDQLQSNANKLANYGQVPDLRVEDWLFGANRWYNVDLSASSVIVDDCRNDAMALDWSTP